MPGSASLDSRLTLAGMSPRRCSVRDGVTITVSSRFAGDSMISTSAEPFTGFWTSPNPPARTTRVDGSDGAVSKVNRPSGPVTVCCWTPAGVSRRTAAPDTAPPLESLTTPVTEGAAASDSERSSASTIILLRF